MFSWRATSLRGDNSSNQSRTPANDADIWQNALLKWLWGQHLHTTWRSHRRSQLDLSGPYQSYSPQHKRTTVKIWLIVFCCCSTSAVDIKVMDDYSTTSFIQAFTRFACDHGFPKRLLSDEGSQLIKGCNEMKLSFTDIKAQLIKNSSVEFEVCPVQGHNMHGKVERKIKEINLSIAKSVHNHRLSMLEMLFYSQSKTPRSRIPTRMVW